MARRLSLPFLSIALFALMPGAAVAQDVRTVLAAVSRNIGADNLRCVTYAGSGYAGAVGQNYTPRDDWPRIELASYTKSVNFEAKSAREEQVRRQGNFPARGGGGIPIQGEVRQMALVSGNYAWSLQGNNANPQPAAAEQRQLDLWITPHGFVKAARAASNPVMLTRYEGGEGGGKRQVRIISITLLGKYRVNGTINEENLVERVQTWIPNPVIGDMYYEWVYSNYKDFGGVTFPTRFHHHSDWDDESSGNPVVRGGHHAFDITVNSVQPNTCGEPISVPDAVQKATIPPVRVESQKVAEGVYLIGGGSHNSVAVEFGDFVAIVEAPLNEERSLAVISEVRKLIPNKRITHVVNTHHHFDHSGGLRAYVHEEGPVIITHRGNRDFYGQELFSLSKQRTLQPDRLSLYPPEEAAEGYRFETVVEKYTLSDGTRTMDVHNIQGLNHVEGMLIAYLPKEKIIIEADMFNVPAAGAPPPTPTPAARTFWNNVQRLKLDITTLVPIHGPAIPWSDFVKIVGSR
ncbi:MAG: MBL fold metallo-hydrolase [Acidobacteria bacterium]|nr:MBL fold metallo-hydrolase [Acidobacteriota bacterium]